MKIFSSPSESKKEGGEKNFDFSLLFGRTQSGYDFLNHYEQSVQKGHNLETIFGIMPQWEWCLPWSERLAMRAVQRYTGVAYEALSFDTLSYDAQEYLMANTLIFSNLFGAIRASDMIPDYRLKQGVKIEGVNVPKMYHHEQQAVIEDWIGDDEIYDLRAGYYEKFFIPRQGKVNRFIFLKNGKIVSHWAKYYRGQIWRYLVENREWNETSDVKGLRFLEQRVLSDSFYYWYYEVL